MVQIVMASLVAVMSLFFANANSHESSSSSGQASDYAVDIQASGPVVNAADSKGSSAVPEPATMALIAPLLTGLWVMRRKS